MWFDPAQLMQNADSTSATFATTATFTQSTTVNDGKVARVAKVATTQELIPEHSSIKPTPEQEAALLQELQTEQRRQKVIAMLESTPDTQRAIYPDTDSDPNNVILAIAVRNVATCEMLIPKAKYGPWQMLELIEQQGGKHVH